MADDPKPICFVISPIGERGSEAWNRSDKTIRHLITPAAEAHGFEVRRADMEERPGIITTQIIRRLIDSPLVVSDLTDHNPNVFYELAVRHVTRKPLIQIIAADQRVPFDVAMMRTVKFDLADPDVLQQARTELENQIGAVKGEEDLETPISAAIDLQRALESGDESQVQMAELKNELQSLVAEVRGQRQAPVFTNVWTSAAGNRFQPSPSNPNRYWGNPVLTEVYSAETPPLFSSGTLAETPSPEVEAVDAGEGEGESSGSSSETDQTG